MQTATRSAKLIDLARILLLGTLLAVGIGIAGTPELAWMGYALAAVDGDRRGRRACLPRPQRGMG